MVTRIGGLASGMDIDAIVEKLMTAERAPLDKLEQQKQKYEWQRDSYRDINKKLDTFSDYLFDNFRLASNFYKKNVTSSNSNLVTAKATSAATGTLSIDGVSQLAKSAQGVGKTIVATSSTKLSSLNGLADIEGKAFTISAINTNGTLSNKEFKIDTNETIESLVKKINNSDIGVTALFENGKLSITAKNMGDIDGQAEVSVSGGTGALLFNKLGFGDNTTDTTKQLDLATGGLNAIFSINGIATERSSNTFSINGYTVTLNSTFNSQSTLAEHTKNLGNNAFIASSQVSDALDTLNTAMNNVNDKDSALSSHIATSSSTHNFATALGNVINNDKLNSLLMNLGANSAEKLEKLSNLNFTDSTALTTSIESLYDENASQNLFTQDEVNAIKKLFVNEENNSITSEGSIFSSFSQEILTVNNGLTDAQPTFEKITDYFNANLELANANNNVLNANDNYETALNAYKGALKTNYNIDMSFGYTGNLVNSSSIQFSQNGVAKSSADINTLLDNEISNAVITAPVTLTSSTDVDNMVDKIQKFVETYNGLIADLNSTIRESYNREYQPLTDAQREEMSEDEIEKWETKAKTGLLRNDSIISSGLNSLRNTFLAKVAGLGDSTLDSLAELGITTSSKTSDRGKLVIDNDKLREAIEKNPDQVAQVFTQTGSVSKGADGKTVDSRGLAQRLRDELQTFTKNIEKKAGKSTSATTTGFTIGNRLNEIEDSIKRWKTRLTSIEKRYWSQFTAMEQAINKANQQSSLFSSGQM